MKLVTIEEHVLDPAVARASAPTFQQLSPHFGAGFDPASGLPNSPSADVLCDLDEGRIADMDKGLDTGTIAYSTVAYSPRRTMPGSSGSVP